MGLLILREMKSAQFGYIERHQPRISPEENFSKIEVKLLSRSNGIVNNDKKTRIVGK